MYASQAWDEGSIPSTRTNSPKAQKRFFFYRNFLQITNFNKIHIIKKSAIRENKNLWKKYQNPLKKHKRSPTIE